MSRESRRAARNADGISWGGDTRASGANAGKRCDLGGDDHSGAERISGYTWKTNIGKRGKVTQVRYAVKDCSRCGKNWEEPAPE